MYLYLLSPQPSLPSSKRTTGYSAKSGERTLGSSVRIYAKSLTCLFIFHFLVVVGAWATPGSIQGLFLPPGDASCVCMFGRGVSYMILGIELVPAACKASQHFTSCTISPARSIK